MRNKLQTVDQIDIEPLVEHEKVIPIASLVKYRNRGLTYEEIAKLTGCTKQNVHNRLSKFKDLIDGNKDHKKHAAELWEMVEAGLLEEMFERLTDGRLKEISNQVLMISAATARTKIQEITGKASVGNNSVNIQFNFDNNSVPNANAVVIDHDKD